MKTLATAAFAALLLTTAAKAGELSFPSDAPIASITVPDTWTLDETDTGAEVTSPDEAIYFFIDVADAKTTEAVIEDAADFLLENGVTVDAASLKQSTDKLNGMDMVNLDWDGTDKDGPVSIGMSIVQPNPEKLLVITYWGTKGEQEKHATDLVAIINSLNPVK